MFRPWRSTATFALDRWFGNLALMLVAAGVDALLAPLVDAAQALAPDRSALPFWQYVLIGVPALDALNYALHRLFHANSQLWRLHALHHADPELDVSTTL